MEYKVKIKITFKEILLAQNMGCANYRDYIAIKFKDLGYIVADFMELHYTTFQDGDKQQYNIYTVIEGTVGKALGKL